MSKRVKKLKRWVAVFDNHGDMVDPGALAAFKQFCKDFKPDVRIHGGDCIDFRAWRRGADLEDKMESMKADVEAGVEFLSWFKPDVWTMGNHDHRLHRVIESDHNADRRMLAGMLWDRIRDAVPDTKIVPWGKRNSHQYANYKFIHGYCCGMYAAKQAARVYGNVVMGHVHAPAQDTAAHIDGARGYTSGCLCMVDMPYNAGHQNTMRQANGWVYGFEYNGQLAVYLAEQIGGRWFYPTEMGGVA